MNNDYFMGGPMSYRGTPMGYAPSYLSTQVSNSPQNNNTNIIWTMGQESAKAYPLFPGKTVMLMDSESPRFFIKSVDASGYATLKTYSFQEEPSTSAPTAHAEANYITREQLDAAMAAMLDEVKRLVTPAEKEKVEVEVETEKPRTKNLL